MLSVSSYPINYIELSQGKIDHQLSVYDAMVTAARKHASEGAMNGAVAAFEAEYFNSMVLALDHFFLHRGRGQEGKDGNPLNEMRMLCDSITGNDGVLKKDNTIRYDPQKSVTGIAFGGAVVLTRETFGRLADAFFKEIAAKYP